MKANEFYAGLLARVLLSFQAAATATAGPAAAQGKYGKTATCQFRCAKHALMLMKGHLTMSSPALKVFVVMDVFDRHFCY